MQADTALAILQNPLRSTSDVAQLAILLNELILHDFEGLIYLLYRVDVPETEVRNILRQQPQADAGQLLATLLLQRQEAKEKSRQQLRTNDQDIAPEDRW